MPLSGIRRTRLINKISAYLTLELITKVLPKVNNYYY
jgi:hypothetical protein